MGRRVRGMLQSSCILIATRADQPVCLLEYTLKSWAAGRALTEKTPPVWLAVSPFEPLISP